MFSKDKLQSLGVSAGVDQIGVVSAKPLYYMKERLQRRIEEGRITPFEEQNPDLRLSPGHLLEYSQSIITLAIPYAMPACNHYLPVKEPRGKVARCAMGIDYHHAVEEKAKKLVRLIKSETGKNFNYRVLSDRSPLLERELAFNSGLGRIGENCTLINPKYGSYIALGTILTDLFIEPDQPVEGSCNYCGQCRKSCPTGALIEPFIINPYLCLSYLTQATGIFPRKIRPLLGSRIYGCDQCQEACPLNDDVEKAPFPELAFPFFPAEPFLIPLLKMTQKEFKLTIGLTSAGWRGKTTLQRNAVIALGNSRDKQAVEPLIDILKNDPRSVIRLHAAWALGQIGGHKALYALEKCYQNDPEEEIRNEARQSRSEQ